MSASEIAAVIADLTAGRVRRLVSENAIWHDAARPVHVDETVFVSELAGVRRSRIVDATAIYHSIRRDMDDPRWEGSDLYEDHVVAPPFDDVVICYRNQHGNVWVIHAGTAGVTDPWQSDLHDIDWSVIRWVTTASVWVGGHDGHSEPAPTAGPLYGWRIAIDSAGHAHDIRWVQLTETDHDDFDLPLLVLLGSINFLNCTNTELVEPVRPRAERRRLERSGVRVHEINVRPIGRRSVSGRIPDVGGDVPLTSVRGHFARYGPDYGRGLLFGRYAGRFWIPQHARGSAEVGTSDASYRLSPDEAMTGGAT